MEFLPPVKGANAGSSYTLDGAELQGKGMKHFVNFKSVPSLAKKKLASVLTPMGLGKFEKNLTCGF